VVVCTIVSWFKWAAVVFALGSVVHVWIYRLVPIPVTPLMCIRLVERFVEGEELKLEKQWVTIDEVSPYLPLAVIAAEDQNFLSHYGIDFDAIQKALQKNRRSKNLYGASTITQQVAKNVFLWPHRSWIRKILELYYSFLIELFWSKKRIMEVYLNVIEWGDGIYGAHQATQAYFHHPPKQLSREEAALLTAVIPNPRVWRPDRSTPYVLKRKAWILRQMRSMPLPRW
jgi:monofunctional biosynthetic peptidoglycan transglycosylase